MHLYLHVPFCKQACHYCDFHFSTNLSSKAEMTAALCQELRLQKDYLPHKHLETIYLGGGTPSLLTETELTQIFETIAQIYQIQPDAEITVEANPDDLNDAKLRVLRQFANRLSIGVQSFHAPYLQRMNRAHTAQESQECVKRAQDMGFENLTIDLMYGLSQWQEHHAEAAEVWQHDVAQAIALKVPHISAYNLTIEPQTAFGKWLKKGEILPVDEDLSAQQFEGLMAQLMANGYEHYEISNFAQPGRYARHNSSYWRRRPYLGIGPSAHSFNGSTRQHNIAHNTQYIKAIQNQKVPFEQEILTPNDQANDYILTSLRTMWGCELRVVEQLLGSQLSVSFLKSVEKIQTQGWVTLKNECLYLTPKGKLFADRAATELFLV